MKQSIKTLSLVSLRVSPQNIVTLKKKTKKKTPHCNPMRAAARKAATTVLSVN